MATFVALITTNTLYTLARVRSILPFASLARCAKCPPAGVLRILVSLVGATGKNPQAGLVQGSDGDFYGTTSGGGAGGAGTVFRLTIVPEFQAVTLTNSTLNLTWSTEAGGVYQLQSISDLSSTNWTNLGSPATAAGATLSTTDSVTNAPQRFYRLVVAP